VNKNESVYLNPGDKRGRTTRVKEGMAATFKVNTDHLGFRSMKWNRWKKKKKRVKELQACQIHTEAGRHGAVKRD